MDKNSPLEEPFEEPLKVEKNARVRNVVRFRLIALVLTVVGLLVIGLNFGIQR
jgi:hypothetical protein